jgi:hypothetical protein
MLCKKASDERNCNIAILTDFDISGIAMCLKIPWAVRIGIDETTISSLGLTEDERRQVQERYNADRGQMKFVTESLHIREDLDYNIELIRSLNLRSRQDYTIPCRNQNRIRSCY